VQERYTRHLQAQGAGWTAAFSTMMMDNPQHYIDLAREQYDAATAVRGVSGSYEATLEPTAPEQLIEAVYGSYHEIYCDYVSDDGDREKYPFTDVLKWYLDFGRFQDTSRQRRRLPESDRRT
jgi:hypothetical protein